jgi:hypothetical protein
VPSKEEPIAYTKCNPCPEGKNSSEKGRMCAECPVGGYTTKGRTGSKDCNFCEASKYLLRRSSTRLDDLCVQFPGIQSYEPKAGPAQGGTLLTFNLGAPKPKPEEVSDPRCRFGSVVVAGTFDNIGTVKCLSPRRLRNDGQVAVEVSLNGGEQYTSTPLQSLQRLFKYYDDPLLQSVSPLGAPVSTEPPVRVTIFGAGFIQPTQDSAPKCR